MDQIRKKVSEAHFFLRQMSQRTRLAFGDHEEFDYYLSAFLSAARCIDYRLRHEEEIAYPSFRDNWDKSLPAADGRLMKFMIEDRNLETHESGSSRNKGESRIPVSDYYEDESGTVTCSAPIGTPPAEVFKPTFSFTIDRSDAPVLECCEKYLVLLEQMVKDYFRSQGIHY